MGRTLIQLFVDGLSMGVVYMLMSSGFNLVMAVPNIIFIAFGHFYMWGAFSVWYLQVELKVNYFPRSRLPQSLPRSSALSAMCWCSGHCNFARANSSRTSSPAWGSC